LKGEKQSLLLVKIGIVIHFLSSIGPYLLGPLMAFEMQDSPWYQQAIFFYLHFQYFGSFLMWFLAITFQKSRDSLSKNQVYAISISLVLLYAHSLDFSFNHWIIQFAGYLGSIVLCVLLFSFQSGLKNKRKQIRVVYSILLLIAVLNCFGSLNFVATLVSENRFVLIAWLHLLFLGLYLPFIWVESSMKINTFFWVLYAIAFAFSELVLVFPKTTTSFFSTSVMWLLFIGYLGVVICISVVHLTSLLGRIKSKL